MNQLAGIAYAFATMDMEYKLLFQYISQQLLLQVLQLYARVIRAILELYPSTWAMFGWH